MNTLKNGRRTLKMKTSKLCLISLCVALIAMSATCSYAANMLPDGGFTTVPSSLTDEGSTWLTGNTWVFQNVRADGGNELGVLNQVAGVSGGYAAQITRGSGNSWLALSSGAVQVTAGQSYNFSFWMKLNDPLLDTWGNVASFGNSDFTDWKGNTLQILTNRTEGWVHYQGVYTAPTGANYAQVQFCTNYAGTVATVSDVYLGAVPEPGSMAAVLSGFVGLIGFATRRRK
ncbi:PEP-CTERM sorting domain-containing protein [bacterium]|nr:PEP-CTERM sorting domain-containing protein [bacterium]